MCESITRCRRSKPGVPVPRSDHIVSAPAQRVLAWKSHEPCQIKYGAVWAPTDAVFGSLSLLLHSRPLLPPMSASPQHANPEAAVPSVSDGQTVTPVPAERKAGASWADNEQQVLPDNRFWIVFPGLMCCIFLAALDQVRFLLISPLSLALV
jgi:hypothetical protein